MVQTLIVKGLLPGTVICNSFICKKQKGFLFYMDNYLLGVYILRTKPKWTELTAFSSFHLSIWSLVSYKYLSTRPSQSFFFLTLIKKKIISSFLTIANEMWLGAIHHQERSSYTTFWEFIEIQSHFDYL